MTRVPNATKQKGDEARALLAKMNGSKNSSQSQDEFIDVNQVSQNNANAKARAKAKAEAEAKAAAELEAEQLASQQSIDPSGDSPGAHQLNDADSSAASEGLLGRSDNSDDDSNTWKLRYTNLRNSRDDKLDQSNQLVSDLRSQLSTRDNYISELEAKLQIESASSQVDNGLGLTDEQKELLTDAEQSVYQTIFDKLNGKIESMQQAPTQQASATVQQENRGGEDEARSQYYSTLDKLAPNWEAVNDREDWKAWLREIDPATGVRRQITLSHLDEMNNANGVFEMFKKFEEAFTSGWTPQGSTQNGNANPTRSGDMPTSVSRGDMTLHDGAQGGQQQAEMISAADFKQFYTNYTKAKTTKAYNRNPDEWEKQKAYYDLAAQQGRLV